MSNIYLEAGNWRSQNFDSLGLKILLPGQFCGGPNNGDIIAFWNFLL